MIALAVAIMMTLGVVSAGISIKESNASAAEEDECASGGKNNDNNKDTATCTYQKQQHSNDFSGSNSAKSDIKTKLDHGLTMNPDATNNNNDIKKHDTKNDTTPFILPFP